LNKVLKVLLIILGIGLVGYTFYFKEAVIHSPESARENTLVNAARFGPEAVRTEFLRINKSMSAGWNTVLVMGLAVIVVTAALRNSTKP